MQSKKPQVLIILDGFGLRQEKKNNAVALAKMPNFNSWMAHYPQATLQAAGIYVGLLDKVVGNSEVGHFTIGAGRVLPQPLLIIHSAIEDGSLYVNPILIEKFALLKERGGILHIMGLLSDGGVHSHQELLYALIKAAYQQGIKKIVVHAFLDGRDVAPQSAEHYLSQLQSFLNELGVGIIGSIHGRYYAMDRDQNWDRTESCYKTLTEKQTVEAKNWELVLQEYYAKGIYDEFIPPTQLNPQGVIGAESGVIFFNIRPDRARQLTAAFTDPHFKAFHVHKTPLSFFITPIPYDNYEHSYDSLFTPDCVYNTLKDVLSAHDKTIFSVAESEKYAHVTYFFTGMREEILPHEVRILIPSLHVKSYDKDPEMSAAGITQVVLKSLKKMAKDFYLINYANADMVGHAGNLSATIKALEFLDGQLKILYDAIVEKMNGTIYITSDHGKAEDMYDDQNKMSRKNHTDNPVPFIMLRKDLYDVDYKLNLHELADIAPFILKNMGLPVPYEMMREQRVEKEETEDGKDEQ